MKSKTLREGEGVVQFSYFMSCHIVISLVLDGLLKIVLDCLRVVIDVFGLVVGSC